MAHQIIVIPSYEPDHLMVELVEKLRKEFSTIIVVDDGSSSDSLPYFEKLEPFSEVTLLQHEKNMGKGAALKTAFRYVREHFPESQSVILCDADGQHLPKDILRIAKKSKEHPQDFVFGVRKFDRKKTPFRSWFGNMLTQAILKLVVRTALNDTQTGLRAYPTIYLNDFIQIPYDRYEYDTESIILISRKGWKIRTNPIQTIYIEGNRSSHFHPIIDSVKIYWVILKFSLVSIFSFLIDVGIFSFLTWASLATLPALFISRMVSAIFNFFGNRALTFRSHTPIMRSLMLYVALWIVNVLLGAYLIDVIVHTTSWHKVPAKVLVDLLLFILNFFASKLLIFSTTKSLESSS